MKSVRVNIDTAKPKRHRHYNLDDGVFDALWEYVADGTVKDQGLKSALVEICK